MHNSTRADSPGRGTRVGKGRFCAAAILFAETGRYLMNLRDDHPWVHFPARWACFGGAVERGERPEQALRREIAEELGYQLQAAEFFTEFRLILPFPEPREERIAFFAAPIAERDVAGMQLREGAGLKLFTPGDLAAELRTVPWDIAAVLMHAQRSMLFGTPAVAPARGKPSNRTPAAGPRDAGLPPAPSARRIDPEAVDR